jgi:hypothetical protein
MAVTMSLLAGGNGGGSDGRGLFAQGCPRAQAIGVASGLADNAAG